jgi:hypothetical protein
MLRRAGREMVKLPSSKCGFVGMMSNVQERREKLKWQYEK